MQFEQAILKAVVGRQPLDGDLAQLREQLSQSVAEKRTDFEYAMSEVDALREALPDASGTVRVTTDDILTAVKADFLEQREKVLAAKAIEHGFRVRHGRLELPSTPSAALSTLKCAACWLIETVGNTGFLVTAHLAAGVPQALGISALASGTNVLASAMGGYFIGRYRKWGLKAPDSDADEFTRRRRVAHLQFGVFAGLIGFLHLTMGAIRSQETLTGLEHSLGAYVSAFGDPQSFLLMLAGACMSCYAYFKGMNGFDDAYPEYSRHARNVIEAIDEVEELRQDGIDQIDDRYEALLKEADENSEVMAGAYQDYNDAVKRSHSSYRALKSAICEGEMHLRTEVANLITIYKSAQNAPQAPFDADQLGALCGLPECEMPVLPNYIHPPQSTQVRDDITAARDQALNNLSEIYAGAIR